MRIISRSSTADDLDISRISVAGWRHAYRGIMPDELLDALDPVERALSRSDFLSGTSLSTYVCIDDDRMLGFVDFELCRDDDCDDSVGEIWAIYVLPEFIGEGVGARLLAEAEKDLQARGCSEITVWVLSQNTLARAFYEHKGYSLDGSEKEYLSLLEVRYRKTLESPDEHIDTTSTDV